MQPVTCPSPHRQVAKLLGSNIHLVHKELLILLQDDALEVSPPPRTHRSTSSQLSAEPSAPFSVCCSSC